MKIKLISIIGILTLLIFVTTIIIKEGKNTPLGNKNLNIAEKTNQNVSTKSKSTSLTPTPTPSINNTSPTLTNTTYSNNCNNLLVLVDKIHSLPSTYVPPDLVNISDYNLPETRSGLQIRQVVITQLINMMNDAKKDGIDLTIVSPYRSYEYQKQVHDSYVAQDGEANADTYSAIPGESQHQLGTAIDFSTNTLSDQLDQSFGNTAAGKWMSANAYKYGFVLAYPQGDENITGYEYEPWHYRYIGVDNAKAMINSGMILQQFLEKEAILPNC